MNTRPTGAARQIALLRRLHSQLRAQSAPSARHAQTQRSWTPHTRTEPPPPPPPPPPVPRASPWPGATPYARVRASPRPLHARGRGRHAAPRDGGVGVGVGEGVGASGQTWYPRGYFISYTDLERALERRGLTFLRVALAGIAGLGCVSALMWPRIKRWGAAEGAEVAAASLQQEELKAHAGALVSALIADPSTAAHAEAVLKGVMSELLADAELKAELTSYMADVMADALMWPNVLERGNDYVDTVLSDEASIAAATQYFSEAAQRTADDEAVRSAASRALWGSLRSFFWGWGTRAAPPAEAQQPPTPAENDAPSAGASVDSASSSPTPNKE